MYITIIWNLDASKSLEITSVQGFGRLLNDEWNAMEHL